MKRWRKAGKLRAGFLAAAMSMVFVMQTVVTTPAQERKPSLSFEAVSTTTGEAVQGVEWSVYRVADMQEDESYRLTASFASSGLDIKKLEQKKYMRESAEAIARYAADKQIKADQTAVTGRDGAVDMGELSKGIYLVRMSGTPGTDLKVESEPFFITLPMLKEGESAWTYDVVARPKVATSEKPTESQPDETKPEESTPEESKPEESQTGESKPEESQPEESKSEESKPEETEKESKPEESNPSEPATEESKPNETTGTTTGGGGSGGGSHNRDHGGGRTPGTGTTLEEIFDNPTPLASFLPSPEGTPVSEEIEIEDMPVPLAGFPHIPKLGDMGMGGYMTGLIASFLLGCCALIQGKKYRRGEH